MTFSDIEEIAAYHEKRAQRAFIAGNGMGPCLVADEFRRQGVEHAHWAEQLRALVAPELVTDLSLEAARHGMAMQAKVIAAMEKERLALLAQLADLRMGKMLP